VLIVQVTFRHTGKYLFAHQAGAATFSESTGQPGQSKLHKVVPAGLRPSNGTTRMYVGLVDIVRCSWARSDMPWTSGKPGPGTEVKHAYTAAAEGGGGARTRMTDVSGK
jgi:hypothetical protein